MLSLPLTNFEMQTYYQKKPKLNGVFPRNNLSKTKDGRYIINLDEYESIGTHGMALYVYAKNLTCFDSFEVKQISSEIRRIHRK